MTESTATQRQEIVPKKAAPIHKTTLQPNPSRHRVSFSRLEIGSIVAGAVILVALTIAVISSQIGLTKAQFGLQQVNQRITTIQNRNVNTKQEINSLSSRDRLLKIAEKDGLMMNNSSIRNVTK